MIFFATNTIFLFLHHVIGSTMQRMKSINTPIKIESLHYNMMEFEGELLDLSLVLVKMVLVVKT